jgi:hypothetical protein
MMDILSIDQQDPKSPGKQITNARMVQKETRGVVQMSGLQEKIRQWKEVDCIICWVTRGEAGSSGGKGWAQCRLHSEEEMQGMEEGMERVGRVGRVEWKDWAGCRRCRVPQGACHGWYESAMARGGMTAGFKRRQGVQCQGKGVFKEAVAAVMSQVMLGKDGKAWEWAEREMQTAMGFWRQDIEETEQLWEFVRRRRKENGYDISEAARMVYFWG